jgi:hypothetical protein
MCRTILSKPLACPSALDRAVGASYVEGSWSPALLPLRKTAGKSSRKLFGEFGLREAQKDLSL